MNSLYYTTLTTIAGKFSVAVNTSGAVAAAAFAAWQILPSRLRSSDLAGARWIADEERTAEASAQVRAYFAGERTVFNIPLALAGTPFQERVWHELNRIPYGETRSYGDLARTLGTSARAVGHANGANPVCLIVPCHRVIGADGTLTGYAFGEDCKRALLNHEAAARARSGVNRGSAADDHVSVWGQRATIAEVAPAECNR